jgi:hypothetical protein
MRAIDALEQVLSEERRALVTADWETVQACARKKDELARELTAANTAEIAALRIQTLREAVLYNAELACTLSRRVGSLLSTRTSGSTYTSGGRPVSHAPTVISLAG